MWQRWTHIPFRVIINRPWGSHSLYLLFLLTTLQVADYPTAAWSLQAIEVSSSEQLTSTQVVYYAQMVTAQTLYHAPNPLPCSKPSAQEQHSGSMNWLWHPLQGKVQRPAVSPRGDFLCYLGSYFLNLP